MGGNMKKYNYIIILIISMSLFNFTGCDYNKVNNGNEINISKSISTSPENVLMAIKFYQYDDNGGEKIIIDGKEYYSIEKEPIFKYVLKSEYDTKISQILIDSIKEIYKIELNKVDFQKDFKLIVDINSNSERVLDMGSCGSQIITRELIDTLVNLPKVENVEFRIDGKKEVYGNHYNLSGIFQKQH
jgi:hypothetical protein